MNPMNRLDALNMNRQIVDANGDIIEVAGMGTSKKFQKAMVTHFLGDIVESCKAAGIEYEYDVKGLFVHYPTGLVRYNLQRQQKRC